MRIISWNVNGLRANCKKGFLNWFKESKADIICLQEVRAFESQLPTEIIRPRGYFVSFNPALKPGYSGTAIFSKNKPLQVIDKIGFKKFDQEGRFLRFDFPNFILINLYIPHGGRQKENLKYKLEAYKHLLSYIRKLKDKKIIILGDFNIAHEEIDLARPKNNINNIMFTKEERQRIDEVLKIGFVDSFRKFNKETGNYTWWSHMAKSRDRNIGWRIDYAFVSKKFFIGLKNAFILDKVLGSDHCPIGLELKV
jgi:exodeoxyribonuclease-3